MAEQQSSSSVFISYARADDEPFVEGLQCNLTKAGIRVWWDREAMESRGRTFLQEIQDAIEGVDRVIAVVGPKALESEYVRYEWGHAQLFAKVIVPLLRLGEYEDVPTELVPDGEGGLAWAGLGDFHCVDFREERCYDDALCELLRVLAADLPSLAEMGETPRLPRHFLPRRGEIKRIQKVVLADVHRPTVISGADQIVALQGMGGAGKSVLAAAFARMTDTRRVFEDGIAWLTAGEHADEATLLDNIKRLWIAFKGDLADYSDDVEARSRLSDVLVHRVCLIVLDDVWSSEQAEVIANALGPRCRLLLTTRDEGIAAGLARLLALDELSEEESLSLLAEWSQQPSDELPQGAREVARECGNLPLTLAMVGAMVRGRPDRWGNALHRLRTADLEKLKRQFPNYPYPTLLRAFEVSVEALEPADRARYLDLAAFRRQTPIPEDALRTLWEPLGFDAPDTQDLIDLLIRRSLVRRDLEGRITLHALQADYVSAQAEDLAALHRRLLDAYAAACLDGWPTGPNDGYFFEHLLWHLNAAGQNSEVAALLCDFRWIMAKLKATECHSVLSDFRLIMKGSDKALAQLRDVLWSSRYILQRDPMQLPGQLIGRLRDVKSRKIQGIINQAKSWRGHAWLEPLTQSLSSVGPQISDTLTAGGNIMRIAVSPDARHVAVASGAYTQYLTLSVWDIQTGVKRRERSFLGTEQDPHPLGLPLAVTSCTLLFNGRLIIFSVLGANTLWDTEEDEKMYLKGPGQLLAVSKDGKRLLKTSRENRIAVWDIERGEEEVVVLKGPTSDVTCAAISSDCRKCVAGSRDGTLRMWNLAEPTRHFVLGNHDEAITFVAVSSDDRWVVTGSDDKTLRVWDLSQVGQIKNRLELDQQIVSLSINSDDKRVILLDGRGEVHLWDIGEKEAVKVLNRGVTRVVQVEKGLDPGSFITLGEDDTVRIWGVGREKPEKSVDKENGAVKTIQVTPKGDIAIGIAMDGSVRVWNILEGATGSVLYSIPPDKLPWNWDKILRVSGDGRTAVLGYGRDLRIWDVSSRIERGLIETDTYIEEVAISRDGRTVATLADVKGKHISDRPRGFRLFLWDIESKSLIREKYVGEGTKRTLTFSPDGNLVICMSFRYESESFSTYQMAKYRLESIGDGWLSLSVIPVLGDSGNDEDGKSDRNMVVEAGRGRNDDFARIERLHIYKLLGLELSSDCSTALVTRRDLRSPILVDMHSGETRYVDVKNNVTSEITCAALSDDGNRAGIGTEDCLVSLWDLKEDKMIAALNANTQIKSVGVSSDGSTIVAGDSDGNVHFLRLNREFEYGEFRECV